MAGDLPSERIEVVAGILWGDDYSHILVSRRPLHLHKGGYWEFPGGKLEPGETPLQALERELFEELNICISSAELFMVIDHDYPEKQVRLSFYDVEGITGEVSGQQGQEWKWVPVSELGCYEFPEANRPVVDALLKAV